MQTSSAKSVNSKLLNLKVKNKSRFDLLDRIVCQYIDNDIILYSI